MISFLSKIPTLPLFNFRNCHKLLYPLFWGTLAALLYFYVTRPICDPDFWWHLKSGDLMLQQKGLLPADPFNYTGDGIVRGFQAVLLYGYWLWEASASTLYQASAVGINGVFVLKFFTAFQLSWGVIYEMSRQRLSQFTMIILTGLGSLVVTNVFHLERPQVFSFFFMTLLIGMIARIRLGRQPSFLLFPLMVLWANVHRGFVIGDIVLLLSAIGFLIQFRHDSGTRRKLITWAAAGILVSFINPNGWLTATELVNFMQISVGPAYVNEYQSSWKLFTHWSKLAACCLWGLALLHLAAILFAPRRFWPDIFISVFIIAIGLAYVRNAGFIAVSLLPMTGWYCEQVCDRLQLKLPGYVQATVCSLLVVVISGLALGEWSRRRAYQAPISSSFPVGMANFLATSGISGNLFNDYNDGGYLDWALYPQWKTFIDGRELNPQVSQQYVKILAGAAEDVGGIPYYQQMLARYGIDVVALGIARANGRLQPLLKLLLNRPEWVPVYLDSQSFVLARFTPQHATIIKKLGLDKRVFLERLTLLAANFTANSPQSVRHLVLYTDTLSYCGRFREAEYVFRQFEPTIADPALKEYLRACLRL